MLEMPMTVMSRFGTASLQHEEHAEATDEQVVPQSVFCGVSSEAS